MSYILSLRRSLAPAALALAALSGCAALAPPVTTGGARASLMPVEAAATLVNEQALATNKNCFACHAQARTLVGPSWEKVAQRYRGDATALALLEKRIVSGSTGVWGPIPMPAIPTVSKDEAGRLARWILSTPAPQ